MRAKTWLFEQGHIKSDGRGRMPNKSMKDGSDIATLLLNSGVRFTDWPKGQVTKSKDTVTITRDDSMSNHKVVSEIHYTYPADEFVAYEFIDGKKSPVSMKEACNNCRVSLVAHNCAEPTYLGDRRVFIERKVSL